MRAVDLIEKKKRGLELTAEELTFLVQGFTNGEIPDYQLSAWAMAVYFKGMTAAETAALTLAMAQSGDQVDLSSLGDKTVDKHSTGGVGDKTTLIVAPIVASLGGIVAKMSGRGLGHTGGTVDKLESIPGYQTELTSEQFMCLSKEVGLVVAGQSGNLAPADKKLYALRDVTATVDSIPLIASSIMSKKLAAGAKSIVLDVKCGSGAFMKNAEDAAALAEEMVAIGENCGRSVSALITNMDRPLGNAVGNALEVEEALAVLQGEGPKDLKEVCLTLASEMLSLCNGWSGDEAMQKATAALSDGTAFAKMKEWIACQGGDLDTFLKNRSALKIHSMEVLAPASGYITQMDAEGIGVSAMLLGAGRAAKNDCLDYDAGIILVKKTGDRIEEGEPIARLFAKDPHPFTAAKKRFLSAITIGEGQPAAQPLIYRKIGGIK
ncbi:MAG: pyrimidine-nucleoside phosphorylase [Clostridia bacterium]|nr:pyrimidine-nucleoside phosphorylase [Clostridia bacterium]